MDTAEKYLDFAIQFTPQYGDSFLELLRLVMIREVILPWAQKHVTAEDEERGQDEQGGQVMVAKDDPPTVQDFLQTETEQLELR